MGTRELLICTAADLIHKHGYNNVGIKSILDEVKVPKGSFYYYFDSKEALGLAIIDLYIEDISSIIAESDKTLDGLKNFFNIFFNRLRKLEFKRGCPVGNLILEMADESDKFRKKLNEWYKTLENWISDVLKIENIEDPEGKAKVIISAFEGAILLSKLDKSDSHFLLFDKYTLNAILKV